MNRCVLYLNMTLCPSNEYFTLGIRVPGKQKVAQLRAPASRLEYQGRTTTVNVKMVKPGFLDEKRKIFQSNSVDNFLLARQSQRKTRCYKWMGFVEMGPTRY